MKPWQSQAIEVLGLAALTGLLGGAVIAWILKKFR